MVTDQAIHAMSQKHRHTVAVAATMGEICLSLDFLVFRQACRYGVGLHGLLLLYSVGTTLFREEGKCYERTLLTRTLTQYLRTCLQHRLCLFEVSVAWQAGVCYIFQPCPVHRSVVLLSSIIHTY